jgi:hypothetical protein
MNRQLRTVRILMAMLVLGLATGSWAMKVGLLGGDTDTVFVQGYLQTQGFASGDLTYIDTRSVTPTLSDMQAFDALLVWDLQPFLDTTVLGNNLADYVDAGGKVVIATFSFYGGGTVWTLSGRIMSPDYSPFTPVGSYFFGSTLGPYDGSSPIMAGVSILTGKYRDQVTLNAGATLVASWADGSPLAAWSHNGQVIGVTLYPGQNDQTGLAGDYPQLFANALRFSSLSAGLDVYVELPDFVGEPALYNVKVELLQAGTVLYTSWAQGTPTATVVSFSGITPGQYDVRVSAPHWLSTTVSSSLVSGPQTLSVTLVSGDLNGDGSVGLLDLGILKKNWGKHA